MLGEIDIGLMKGDSGYEKQPDGQTEGLLSNYANLCQSACISLGIKGIVHEAKGGQ